MKFNNATMRLAALSLGSCLTFSACADLPLPRAAAEPSPQEDGHIPDGGISPFDDSHPALRNLDEKLLQAVRKAAKKAAEQNVKMHVTSGWRSVEYQRRLQEQAVSRYGSEAEAKRFVLPPEKSAHVKGTAVDIGPTAADDWLIRKGAAFGLCQTYANEMWHFELATTPGGECPPQLPDATAAR